MYNCIGYFSDNELFADKLMKEESYVKQEEENMVELKKLNEEYVKKLLMLEWVLIIIGLISFFMMLYVGVEIIEETFWKVTLVSSAILILILCIYFAILIEQVAGYYECRKCRYRYIPTYSQVLWAMHCGRTRYLKCPKCNKKSWNKKVLIK